MKWLEASEEHFEKLSQEIVSRMRKACEERAHTVVTVDNVYGALQVYEKAPDLLSFLKDIHEELQTAPLHQLTNLEEDVLSMIRNVD